MCVYPLFNFSIPQEDNCLGLCVQANFGFDFMLPLVSEMTQDDPAKRPTIDQVVARFQPVYRCLSTPQLRSRAVQRKEDDIDHWWRDSIHFFRRMRFVLLRIPPIPPPVYVPSRTQEYFHSSTMNSPS
jgi:hypothetical protein